MATYMEVKITPKRHGEGKNRCGEVSPVLVLAPFNKPPTVEFKNVRVGVSATQSLLVRNPSASKVQVEICKLLPPERGVSIMPTRFLLEQKQELSVELEWRPLAKGSWRDVMQVKAGRFLLLDVVCLFSADAPSKCKKKPLRPLTTQNTNLGAVSKMKMNVDLPVSRDVDSRATIAQSHAAHNLSEDKENIEDTCSPLSGCSGRFTNVIESSFVWPDITASTPLRRETYTLTMKHSPECVTISNTYKSTILYPEPTAPGSSSSEQFSDSLRSDNSVADIDETEELSFVHCVSHHPAEAQEEHLQSAAAVGLDVDSFSSKLKCIKLDGSVLSVAEQPLHQHPIGGVCDVSFTIATSSPADSLDSTSRLNTRPVLLEISPPIVESVRRTPASAKCQKFHHDKMNKVLKSTGMKMKHSTRTQQSKILKNLKLLPSKCKGNVVEMLSPVSGISTSKRGVWGTSNPFKASSVYQTEEWLVNQEREFTKWLNALLTPPAELECYTSIPAVNVVELWKKSCKSKTLELAPSRETVSSRFNTRHHLERIRLAARALFHSKEVMCVLEKVSSHIDNNLISIRADRLVHKDVGLRCSIVELLLNYNPLWLRIGLETLYKEKIPLRSNSDVLGLATFIRTRVLSDPYIVKTFTHPTVRKYYLPGFEPAINKFILKKLFFLIYLLDLAKNLKIISHNPCLFCKNSNVKKSKDVLLALTREIISKMGDITSYLRHLGYVVTHEQTYLDEYDYAVANLSWDLRDGIRLTRVMEIILRDGSLSKQLRYPPISLLQKKHNVQVALTALKCHGYELQDDITMKDIVEGHREKTLSMLWQLIYKFEAPLFSDAAVVIQRWWRSHLECKVRAAVIIQKAWRNHIAKKQQKLKITKSKLFNQNKAAVTIQNMWRCYVAKKHLEKLRAQHKAAVTIQNTWRCYVAKKHLEKLRAQHKAAVTIQNMWRCYVAKKHLKKLRAQHKAAVTIHNMWRCYVAKKHLEKLRAQHKAAVTIQNTWRCYVAKKLLKKLRAQHKAAVTIQNMWRCYVAKKHLKKLRAQHKAAVTIHNMWRCYVAKKHLKKLRAQHKAAVTIQNMWRCYVAKKHLKKLRAQHKAAVTIQNMWRCYVAKKLLEKLRAQHKAAITIQNMWRCYVAKKHLKKLRAQHKAAVTIQNMWRCYVAKKHLKKLRAQHKAAVTIHNMWRCYVAKKHLKKLRAQHKAAVTIQNMWRCYVAKKLLEKLRAQHKAAITIQNMWRCYVAKKHLKKLRAQHKAAVTIQNMWRCYVAKKHLKKLRAQHKAAVTIQNTWRCYVAKKHLKKLRAQHKAAVTIQNMWRCYVAKKLLKKLKVQHKAAVTIQNMWRCYVAKKHLKKLRAQHKAAVTIQNTWRCYVAKKLLKKLRAQHKAAVTIQNMWRCYVAMKHLKKLRAQHKAAVTIQNTWRCYVAKKLLKKLRAQHKAAVIIQNMWRCYVAKKHLKKLRAQHKAAVTIQNTWRCYVAKKLLEKLRAQHKAAVTIQNIWRDVAKKHLKKLRTQHKAAVTIQNTWRCYVAKKHLKKLSAQHKVVSVQTVLEYHIVAESEIDLYSNRLKILARNSCEEKRIAAIKIQSYWRKFVARRNFKLLRARRVSACVTIQKVWRGYRTRQLFGHLCGVHHKDPKMILKNRFQSSMDALLKNSSMGDITHALITLDTVTQLSPELCEEIFKCDILRKLCEICSGGNRSESYIDVFDLSMRIIINLLVYDRVCSQVLENVDVLLLVDCVLRIMSAAVSTKKVQPLCNCLTVLWLLGSDPAMLQKLKGIKDFEKYLLHYCQRASKLPAVVKEMSRKHSLPVREPSWTLRYPTRARSFTSLKFAINVVLKLFNVRN